ncbi:tyrosine-type recombinase/integrase [Alteromonas sp. D210916BOD_24]|uniref:integrase n=1 Tax=Alteromonas sp. D210916BOD_24 TaxID=3157618 RepID=UPI00399D1962
MSPKRRTAETSDLPTGLSIRKMRGQTRYRYRYPNGREFFFPISTSRGDAIQATLAFNLELRPIGHLSQKKGDKYNRPLSEWLPKVVERVKADEKPSDGVFSTFLKDIERLVEGFGHVYSKDIDLETVNEFLDRYVSGKSNNVYNRKISFLSKVCSYLVDMSAMAHNYANDKLVKPKEEKKRQRIDIHSLKQIHDAAPPFLRVAIELALETTHATLEISRIKYRDCRFLKEPLTESGFTIYGYMRIRRQKVKKHESGFVEIPITKALKESIDRSREEKIVCPYIVHRIGRYRSQIGEGCDHPMQVGSQYLSRAFSDLRDELGLYKHLKKDERPTFHEIRALAAKMFKDKGIKPTARMAHKDEKTTEIYTENHVEWVRVPAAELAVF